MCIEIAEDDLIPFDVKQLLVMLNSELNRYGDHSFSVATPQLNSVPHTGARDIICEHHSVQSHAHGVIIWAIPAETTILPSKNVPGI